MIESFIYGMLAIFVLLPLAVFTFRWLLEQMDKWIGADFKNEIYPKLSQDPKALAIYLAARLLAVAIIVFGITSRFV